MRRWGFSTPSAAGTPVLLLSTPLNMVTAAVWEDVYLSSCLSISFRLRDKCGRRGRLAAFNSAHTCLADSGSRWLKPGGKSGREASSSEDVSSSSSGNTTTDCGFWSRRTAVRATVPQRTWSMLHYLSPCVLQLQPWRCLHTDLGVQRARQIAHTSLKWWTGNVQSQTPVSAKS